MPGMPNRRNLGGMPMREQFVMARRKKAAIGLLRRRKKKPGPIMGDMRRRPRQPGV